MNNLERDLPGSDQTLPGIGVGNSAFSKVTATVARNARERKKFIPIDSDPREKSTRVFQRATGSSRVTKPKVQRKALQRTATAQDPALKNKKNYKETKEKIRNAFKNIESFHLSSNNIGVMFLETCVYDPQNITPSIGDILKEIRESLAEIKHLLKELAAYAEGIEVESSERKNLKKQYNAVRGDIQAVVAGDLDVQMVVPEDGSAVTYDSCKRVDVYTDFLSETKYKLSSARSEKLKTYRTLFFKETLANFRERYIIQKTDRNTAEMSQLWSDYQERLILLERIASASSLTGKAEALKKCMTSMSKMNKKRVALLKSAIQKTTTELQFAGNDSAEAIMVVLDGLAKSIRSLSTHLSTISTEACEELAPIVKKHIRTVFKKAFEARRSAFESATPADKREMAMILSLEVEQTFKPLAKFVGYDDLVDPSQMHLLSAHVATILYNAE